MVSIGVGSASEPELKKFQGLLRTLFQFDCADLDFGIYRILNYKRQQVEAFITERLPQIVDEAFAYYVSVDREAAERELEELRQRIAENLGPGALDAQGQLQPQFRETPLGKQYQEAQKRLEAIQVTEELKARVYNDLYNFFFRYYEDGDFISKRRYGRGEAYAIPYNGEEVVLYWANKDQYYVKSGEHFRTYRFKAGDYTVVFELRNASTEQNNNKGEKRYFVLVGENPVAWDEKTRTLFIFFEYRSLTSEEQEQYGKTEQQKPQDKLNEEAVPKVLDRIFDPTLKVHLARPEGNGQPLLLKHLTRFTRKNTSDFFIHKDLKGFLLRELDFFIKNEVLLLDELIAGKEQDLDRNVRRARVVRDIGEKIIDFLAQVEDFQKKLWEKKKFVIRTEYCVALDRVPEELWDEVLANEAQIEEWRRLYALDELLKKQGLVNTVPNKDFLRAHPTLVVDTRYFSKDFKWRLLASFDDIDEALDGVLIKSENWQALDLLLEKYRGRVKCIYIDPPYNTGNDEFIYKDCYQHSSWLSMMMDRLAVAMELKEEDGAIFISIDDNERVHLEKMLALLFGEESLIGPIIVQVNKGGRDFLPIAKTHEYLICCSPGNNFEMERERSVNEFPYTDSKGKWIPRELRNRNPKFNRQNRPNLYYPIYVNPNRPDSHGFCPVSLEKRPEYVLEVFPLNSKGEDSCWRWSRQRVLANCKPDDPESSEVVARQKADGGWNIYEKYRGTPQKAKSVWDEPKFRTENGSIVVRQLFGVQVYDFPKPVELVEELFTFSTGAEDLVLDFFAGSGTTAHAVINLNRQDGGRRKYILVEMADYFDTVLLPRIKKVVFCEEWKDGKPNGGQGISHFLKYHYLEQYEDTLNNLELPREQEGQLALEMFGGEYLLKYMLDLETQASPSLLNLEMFKDPFTYRLKVQEGDKIVERNIDLVETFNYLLGIDVKKMRAFEKEGRPYRAVLGEKKGERIAIIWRPVADMEEDKEKLMIDKAFIESMVLPTLLGEGAKPHRLLVNGPCYAEDAEAIEPEFKRLMFLGVV